MEVTSASESGAVRAVYDLAAAVRSGRAGDRAARRGGALAPAVPDGRPRRRGVTPDPAQWASGTDYSHASKAFADVILPTAPYVDQSALAKAYTDFDTFLRHSLANGYTAVAFPGFIEFVTLQDAPDGPVYAAGDEHVARALAMRKAFTPFWDRAQELGMEVVLRTDMLTLTTPLEQYLTEHVGSLDTTSPDLWAVYTAGLDELYAAAPSLDGVLVRIGEAGRVYDVEGWDYYSSLAVTTVDAVRAMLTALTGQAERTGRDVIFRSWSVGRRGRGRHAHQPAVLRGGARRHRLAGAGGLDEVHARRLLQPPAAQRDAAVRQPAADRRVPEPSRVRELRGVPERPRRRVPRRPAAAARREPADRGRVGVDPGRRAVARRPDDALPQVRVLAALRAEHLARGLARARPGRRRGRPDGGLGPPLVLRRPRDGGGRRARRWPARARPSPRASTSARSPSRRSRPSASSRPR